MPCFSDRGALMYIEFSSGMAAMAMVMVMMSMTMTTMATIIMMMMTMTMTMSAKCAAMPSTLKRHESP